MPGHCKLPSNCGQAGARSGFIPWPGTRGKPDWFNCYEYENLLIAVLGPSVGYAVSSAVSRGGVVAVSMIKRADNKFFASWATDIAALHPAAIVHGITTRPLRSTTSLADLQHIVSAGQLGIQTPLLLLSTNATAASLEAVQTALSRWPALQERATAYIGLLRNHKQIPAIVAAVTNNAVQFTQQGYVHSANERQAASNALFSQTMNGVAYAHFNRSMVIYGAALRVTRFLHQGRKVICVPHWPTTTGYTLNRQRELHAKTPAPLNPLLLPLVGKAKRAHRPVAIKQAEWVTWDALDHLFEQGFTEVTLYGSIIGNKPPWSVMAALMANVLAPAAIEIDAVLLTCWDLYQDDETPAGAADAAATMAESIASNGCFVRDDIDPVRLSFINEVALAALEPEQSSKRHCAGATPE
jgi:hypothetical protein